MYRGIEFYGELKKGSTYHFQKRKVRKDHKLYTETRDNPEDKATFNDPNTKGQLRLHLIPKGLHLLDFLPVQSFS